MEQVNVEYIKKVFYALKGSIFLTFEQTKGVSKIHLKANERKTVLDFEKLFKSAGLTNVPTYTAVTSKPSAAKKPKKKTGDELNGFTDTGVAKPTEPVQDLIPTHNDFNIMDIYNCEVVAVRSYEPTATTHRLTFCLDFLPVDIVADKEKAKHATPVLMVITFNLPNRKFKVKK